MINATVVPASKQRKTGGEKAAIKHENGGAKLDHGGGGEVLLRAA